MTTILSVSKPVLALVIGVVTAAATLLGAILPEYLPPTLSAPVCIFVAAVAGVVVVFLTTEESIAL